MQYKFSLMLVNLKIMALERVSVQKRELEGDPQNVLNFGTLPIQVSSDIMLHIGALNALAPRGSDLTAKG